MKIEHKHCKRFVDDIFVLFEKLQHLQEFAEYINKQNLSGRFSTETGKKGALGIKTCREDGTFVTTGQRKDTFSGMQKTFTSFISFEYKCSLLYIFFIGIFDSYWIFQSLK